MNSSSTCPGATAERVSQTPPTEVLKGFSWPEGGVSRVPFQVFSDPAIYALEQEKIFRGPVWHYP